MTGSLYSEGSEEKTWSVRLHHCPCFLRFKNVVIIIGATEFRSLRYITAFRVLKMSVSREKKKILIDVISSIAYNFT